MKAILLGHVGVQVQVEVDTVSVLGMSVTAGDIIGVLLHVGLDGGLHVVVLGGTRPVGVAVDALVHLGGPYFMSLVGLKEWNNKMPYRCTQTG